MAITKNAQKYHNRMFPEYQSSKKRIFILIALLCFLMGSSVVVSAATVQKMTPGQKIQLTVPKSFESVKWNSSKKKVAIVNKKGVVTAKKAGTTVITAKSGNKTRKFTVKVQKEKLYTIQLKIGNKNYTAKLYKNAATKTLIKKLPMIISMNELNGNEKYFYLPYDLPTNEKLPKRIHTGDLMLFGSDCLVLFYKGFETSYEYTKLGYVVDPTGLEEMLGKRNVTVTIE